MDPDSSRFPRSRLIVSYSSYQNNQGVAKGLGLSRQLLQIPRRRQGH
jgi:hypothetical protein